ncbi:transposase, MuDR, MULE transposase domain protein, partial [Tanacetum coccineum]
SIQGNKSGGYEHGWKQPDCANCFWYMKGETGPCWSWWMSVLKECIDDNPNLLFISDMHPSIALAVQNEFLLAFHDVCCRHLMMNLSLKNRKTKCLFWKICKAYTPEEFSSSMNNLQAIQPDASGPQRWSRAHCPIRYNYLTSNSVESVNACIVLYRKLPVLKLAETYRAMVQDQYFKRRNLARNFILFSYFKLCFSFNRILYHLQLFYPLTYYMAYGANEACQATVLKLQREIQAEETLADQLLCNLTRYTEEMRICSVQITMLQSMPTTSLNTYGLHALLMTHEADIRTTNIIYKTKTTIVEEHFCKAKLR